jgi:uncharacterized protein RhaS with RHS repeats
MSYYLMDGFWGHVSSQRTTMTMAEQVPVNYTYDTAGRLSQIAQGALSVGFAYDAAGRRSSVTFPNGVTASYSYDQASRVTEIDYAKGSSPLGNLTYQYDSAGHPIEIGGSLARTGLPAAL